MNLIDFYLNMIYYQFIMQRAFEIGNSVAVTIPKKVGIKPGTAVKFKHEKNKLIYEILESQNTDKNDSLDKQLRKMCGAMKIDGENLMSVLKSVEEDPYDKEVRFSRH